MSFAYSLVLLLLLGITWGSGYVIARIATLNGIAPLAYSFWQSVGPAIFLTVLILVKRLSLPLTKQHVKYYLLCGLIGIALPNTNMYFAAPHLPSGLLAVIVNIAPILTYIFALAIKQERFSWLRLTGVVSGIAGILTVVLPKTNIPAIGDIPWVLVALASPILFAACAVYINAQRPENSDSLILSTGMLLSSVLFLLPSILLHHDFYLPQLPFRIGDWMIALEIVLSSFGYILMFELLKRAGAVFYSLVSGIVLLTGLAWGWIIYGETLNPTEICGIALILCAIILVSFHHSSQRDAH